MNTVSTQTDPNTSNKENKTRRVNCRFLVTTLCATLLWMPATVCAQAEAQSGAGSLVVAAPEAAAQESGTWDAVLSQGIRPDKPKIFTRFSVEQLVRTILSSVAADYARLPLLNYRLGGESTKRLSVNMSVSRRDTSTLALNYRF